MLRQRAAARRCEGGESAGGHRGGSEEGLRRDRLPSRSCRTGAVRSAPPQSPCCESHEPARDRPDRSRPSNELAWLRRRGANVPTLVLFLPRHLGSKRRCDVRPLMRSHWLLSFRDFDSLSPAARLAAVHACDPPAAGACEKTRVLRGGGVPWCASGTTGCSALCRPYVRVSCALLAARPGSPRR